MFSCVPVSVFPKINGVGKNGICCRNAGSWRKDTVVRASAALDGYDS